MAIVFIRGDSVGSGYGSVTDRRHAEVRSGVRGCRCSRSAHGHGVDVRELLRFGGRRRVARDRTGDSSVAVTDGDRVFGGACCGVEPV